MKKLKCIKCGLYYKDRKDPEDMGLVHKELCWNCRFVWKCLGMFISSFPPKINRGVTIRLEDIKIWKGKHKPSFAIKEEKLINN